MHWPWRQVLHARPASNEASYGHRVTDTYFIPAEVACKDWSLPADIYNLPHTLLTRSEFDCVFIAIPSMQYLAVISAVEITFVDTTLRSDVVIDVIIIGRWSNILVMGADGKDESGQRVMQGGDVTVLGLLKTSERYYSEFVEGFEDAAILVDDAFRPAHRTGISVSFDRQSVGSGCV